MIIWYIVLFLLLIVQINVLIRLSYHLIKNWRYISDWRAKYIDTILILIALCSIFLIIFLLF